MTDSDSSAGSSLFAFAADEDPDDADPDRVQELKRILFDLAYLVMNADGSEHISEKMLVEKLERRMEREGSVNVDNRAEALSPLLDEGPDAIQKRVEELADEVADRAGDRVQAVGDRYLDFLKGLIVADASITSEEYDLFDLLCDRWGVEKELP
jgi:hypothetical protein